MTGYTRFSQDGISIENQKASIRDYCRNHDLDLTTIYNDGRRTSGYFVDERPEYQALRETVRNRDVAAITLRDMGRLGRDFDERMLFIIDLRKSGSERAYVRFQFGLQLRESAWTGEDESRPEDNLWSCERISTEWL